MERGSVLHCTDYAHEFRQCIHRVRCYEKSSRCVSRNGMSQRTNRRFPHKATTYVTSTPIISTNNGSSRRIHDTTHRGSLVAPHGTPFNQLSYILGAQKKGAIRRHFFSHMLAFSYFFVKLADPHSFYDSYKNFRVSLFSWVFQS